MNFLSSNIPTILTSYANPADALIVGMILGLSKNQICLYPPSLVVRNTFQGLELNKKELTAAKNLYGLCSTLTNYQIPRTKLLRYILTNVPNHSGLFLFDFVDSPSAYKKLLLSLSGIIIPTNGSQISPQLSSASALGLKVLSDCGFQLLFHDDYQIMNPSFSPIHDVDLATIVRSNNDSQDVISGNKINSLS